MGLAFFLTKNQEGLTTAIKPVVFSARLHATLVMNQCEKGLASKQTVQVYQCKLTLQIPGWDGGERNTFLFVARVHATDDINCVKKDRVQLLCGGSS